MEFKVVNNLLKCTSDWPLDMTVDQALDWSVEKWEAVVKYIEETGISVEDGGRKTCPLCDMFWHVECVGCPIPEVADAGGCDNTPYEQYTHYGIVEDAIEIAREELKFLKGIREARKADSPTVSPQVEG